jgi:hypothetical protein
MVARDQLFPNRYSLTSGSLSMEDPDSQGDWGPHSTVFQQFFNSFSRRPKADDNLAPFGKSCPRQKRYLVRGVVEYQYIRGPLRFLLWMST